MKYEKSSSNIVTVVNIIFDGYAFFSDYTHLDGL